MTDLLYGLLYGLCIYFNVNQALWDEGKYDKMLAKNHTIKRTQARVDKKTGCRFERVVKPGSAALICVHSLNIKSILLQVLPSEGYASEHTAQDRRGCEYLISA